MSSNQIFISYRRDDSAGYARAIYDRLAGHFSNERIFIDVDVIEPGLPFDEVIDGALRQSGVVLVMIGKHWLDDRAGAGPRLKDPADLVRLEISVALARDVRVIPVLLDGATMPRAEDLPESLRPLTRRNAVEVSNSRFTADLERLVSAVRRALGETDLPVISPGAVTRPAVNGDWIADVTYDWPNAHHVERFRFDGDDDELFGTAAFLGTKRGILEGTVKKDRIRFVTKTQEALGSGEPRKTVHRYRGTLAGNEIKFVMQTEGGFSDHAPVEFVAKRVSAAET